MLTRIAQGLSSFFISRKIIKEEERLVYDYSFEIFLSTIFNFLAVAVLAFVSRTIIPTIWFLVGFIAVRSTAGGFHAETHIGCFLIMLFSYVTYLLLILMLSNSALSIITVLFCISSWMLIFILSPVEDYNKPFSKEEHKKFKIVSNTTVVIASIVAFLFIFLEKEKWGFSIAAGICVVSLSLIAGTVKNKLRK